MAAIAPSSNRIKLFQSTQKSYHDVGILPSQLQPNRQFNWKNVLILCFCVWCMIAFVLPLFFKATSMNELAMDFYTSTTMLSAISYYLINFFQRDKIFQVLKNYDEFVEKRCKNPGSQAKFAAVNQKIEHMSKLVRFLLVKVNVPLVALPTLITSMANYYIYDLGEKSFELPCPIMMPFNQNTPFGFILTALLEVLLNLITIFIYIPNITYFVGSCWLFNCILMDSPTLNRNAANTIAIVTDGGPSTSNATAAVKNIKIKKDLCEMVQFLSDVKELVNEFNATVEFISLVFFLWALINIATALLVFEAETESLSFMEVVPVIFVVINLSSVISTICEFGESVATQFERFDDRLCRFKWYMHPIEFQKMYLIFVADAQLPVALGTFATIECTRETLKKTSKAGFSYYTTLRQVRM